MKLEEDYEQVLQLRAQADEMEGILVSRALTAAEGRVSKAAALLGVSHGHLRQLLERGRLRHLSHLAAHIDGRPPAKVA